MQRNPGSRLQAGPNARAGLPQEVGFGVEKVWTCSKGKSEGASSVLKLLRERQRGRGGGERREGERSL
jgi:hypothetical protein